MELALRCLLAAVLALAAALKLRSPRTSQSALATFGLRAPRLRSAVWSAVVATELVLSGGVALGSHAAAYAASAVSALFAAALALALRRGRGGAPCGCFGSRSRVSWSAVARNVVLAAAFALLPVVPTGPTTREGWLTAGLIASLVGLAALTVVVLALAREVGVLRLLLPQRGALEIADEGPELGERADVITRFSPGAKTELALAVFFSAACPLCRSLSPVVEAFRRDPAVSVQIFDEEREIDIWRELRVPGSPYAVALDREGTVLAKGTFNSFGELESVLAAAERRANERAHV